MSISVRNPYEDPESTTTRWVILFVLLSLLAHVIIVAALVLITVFMPVPKIVPSEPASPNVTILLQPPPTPAPAKPKPSLFQPTAPDAQAQHKEQPIESANDTDLKSKNQTARAPEALMPDVTGKKHGALLDVPDVPSPQKPEVSSTPPTPKQAKPEKPTPPQPKPQQAQQTPPQPPQPTPKPAPPTPPKKAEPAVDANGFPVLPPLNVPTMAPPNQAAQPLAPARFLAQTAEDARGAVGRKGDNSPAAMATAFGRYQQKVYLTVGSRWKMKEARSESLIGVGIVEIQITIHSDGTVKTKVLDDGGNSTQVLLAISLGAILEAAPYDKFEDYPGMREEIIKKQGGDGSSYVEYYSFAIYSP